MALQESPLPFFPSTTNMTTAGREIVGCEITTSPILLEKTRGVVIAREGKTVTMSVFRESSASPGSLSRDIYVRKGKAWRFKRKDPKKYLTPPDPPPGAIEAEINGVKCWTMHPLTDEDKKWLSNLISQTPLQGRNIFVVAHSVIR